MGVLTSGTVTIANGETAVVEMNIAGPVVLIDCESDGPLTLSGWLFARSIASKGALDGIAVSPGATGSVADGTRLDGTLVIQASPIPVTRPRHKTIRFTVANASGASRYFQVWVHSANPDEGE